jgi:PhnB protein
MPISPCPPDMRWVNPYLTVRDIDEAVCFYTMAFGFKVKFSMKDPEGKTAHTELSHYDCTIMLNRENPAMGDRNPKGLGGSPVMLYVYTPDVDKLAARAEDAGATILQPPKDQFWGDRVCIVEDPEGHRWTFATHFKDVPMEEMKP